MILELICDILKSLILYIIGLLPIWQGLYLPIDLVSWFGNILTSVAYFLPVTDLLMMFGFWILTKNFHIIWKSIQRMWDALPFT